jgi:excisionase family DNA binding protein
MTIGALAVVRIETELGAGEVKGFSRGPCHDGPQFSKVGLDWDRDVAMIGKPVALLQVPNQRLFGPKAAARYLGIDTDTLRKLTAEGKLKAYIFRDRRAYRLEELNDLIDSLPEWNNVAGEELASANTGRNFHGR